MKVSLQIFFSTMKGSSFAESFARRVIEHARGQELIDAKHEQDLLQMRLTTQKLQTAVWQERKTKVGIVVEVFWMIVLFPILIVSFPVSLAFFMTAFASLLNPQMGPMQYVYNRVMNLGCEYLRWQAQRQSGNWILLSWEWLFYLCIDSEMCISSN